MPNLYGNIVSNIGAGIVGGPGVAAGANIGHDIALFEPVQSVRGGCPLRACGRVGGWGRRSFVLNVAFFLPTRVLRIFRAPVMSPWTSRAATSPTRRR